MVRGQILRRSQIRIAATGPIRESKVCVGSESEWSIDSSRPRWLHTSRCAGRRESLLCSLDNDCDNLWLRRRKETKQQHLLHRSDHYWDVEGHKQQSCLWWVIQQNHQLEEPKKSWNLGWRKGWICLSSSGHFAADRVFIKMPKKSYTDQIWSFAAPVTWSLGRKLARPQCLLCQTHSRQIRSCWTGTWETSFIRLIGNQICKNLSKRNSFSSSKTLKNVFYFCVNVSHIHYHLAFCGYHWLSTHQTSFHFYSVSSSELTDLQALTETKVFFVLNCRK